MTEVARDLPSVTTAKGDSGTSSLGFGPPLRKDDPVFEFMGSVDELSSYLGVCALYTDTDTVRKLRVVQNYLSELLGCVACSLEPSEGLKNFVFQLESWGCELDKGLPKLCTFLLPGGHPSATFLHLARAVCRKSERAAVAAVIEKRNGAIFCQMFNRLSDYLFLLARYQNMINKTEEILVRTANAI
jgi:cob(I)alamin adenosyltransferase